MIVDIDPECISRYFDQTLSSGKIPEEPSAFLDRVKPYVEKPINIKDGYAPFCKHVFVPNPYSHILPSCVPITADIEIQTDYIARRPQELPVLCRYAVMHGENKAKVGPAKYIDCILYSHQQMVEEYKAMNMNPADLPQADYLIISLKYQNESFETPMQPITMLRNTLIQEGGSGVSLDRTKYMESVAFWKENVELMAPPYY